jgi:hypothetical protein
VPNQREPDCWNTKLTVSSACRTLHSGVPDFIVISCKCCVLFSEMFYVKGLYLLHFHHAKEVFKSS